MLVDKCCTKIGKADVSSCACRSLLDWEVWELLDVVLDELHVVHPEVVLRRWLQCLEVVEEIEVPVAQVGS